RGARRPRSHQGPHPEGLEAALPQEPGAPADGDPRHHRDLTPMVQSEAMRARRRNVAARREPPAARGFWAEALAVVILAFALVLVLSLASYRPDDPVPWPLGHWSGEPVQNAAGIIGAFLAELMRQLLGQAAWALEPEQGDGPPALPRPGPPQGGAAQGKAPSRGGAPPAGAAGPGRSRKYCARDRPRAARTDPDPGSRRRRRGRGRALRRRRRRAASRSRSGRGAGGPEGRARGRREKGRRGGRSAAAARSRRVTRPLHGAAALPAQSAPARRPGRREGACRDRAHHHG